MKATLRVLGLAPSDVVQAWGCWKMYRETGKVENRLLRGVNSYVCRPRNEATVCTPKGNI